MTLLPPRAGLGVRAAHYAHLQEPLAAPGWFEVHSENFFGSAGVHGRLLDRLAAQAPLSFHGVGLALGSTDPLDPQHLDELAALVACHAPALVSEHLCWGHADRWHSNELLPMPYTVQAATRLAERIDCVQQRLKRRIAVENVACYLRFAQDEMSEWEFVREVCERADCLLLLDVANVHVNASNHGFDPADFLRGIPHGRVAEIHLAGHQRLDWGLVDTHDGPVPGAVWELLAQALAWCGPVATLVEWDSSLPPLAVLLDQGARVQALLDEAAAARSAAPAVDPSSAGPAARPPSSRPAAHPPPSRPAAQSPPADLGELQRAFAACLRAHGKEPPATLLAQLAGPPAQLAERLAVYRRSTRHAQLGALSAAFPVLCALTGTELFGALCNDHLQDPGSRSGDLHRLGAGMAATVRAEPACAAYPFLADVAELEWAIHRSQFVASVDCAPCVDPAAVPAHALHRLRVLPAAGLTLLALASPAGRIWRAHQPESSEALQDIDPGAGPEWLAVRRADAGVCLEVLAADEYALLAASQAGLTLAQALDRLEGKAAAPDVTAPGSPADVTAPGPLPAPADLAAWLPRWLASGLVRGLALAPA